jgi:signal transduction histidine kinase
MTAVALESDMPPQLRDYLETVKESADSLLRLLNELLDFAKIDAGKVDLENASFRLRQQLTGACRPLLAIAANKGLELHCHVQPDVPELLVGDSWRLRQVITNLLGNALKFTHKGEVRLTVSTQLATAEAVTLEFAVQDTGIGIPIEKQQIIFDAFTQADGSMVRDYGGTGLGLAICSRLVEKMGGRIWVESDPGAGSTFHFTCRLALRQMHAAAAETSADTELAVG